MKLSIISFTENGILLSEKIAKLPHEAECAIYTKCGAYCKEGRTVEFVTESIGEWAKEQFEEMKQMKANGDSDDKIRKQLRTRDRGLLILCPLDTEEIAG